MGKRGGEWGNGEGNGETGRGDGQSRMKVGAQSGRKRQQRNCKTINRRKGVGNENRSGKQGIDRTDEVRGRRSEAVESNGKAR
jgi:hypothetical protein